MSVLPVQPAEPPAAEPPAQRRRAKQSQADGTEASQPQGCRPGRLPRRKKAWTVFCSASVTLCSVQPAAMSTAAYRRGNSPSASRSSRRQALGPRSREGRSSWDRHGPPSRRESWRWTGQNRLLRRCPIRHRVFGAGNSSGWRPPSVNGARILTPFRHVKIDPPARVGAHAPSSVEAVAATLNGRPRKTLVWKTPAEALEEYLQSIQRGGVATIP